MSNATERDEKLWKQAQERAGFKSHLRNYVVINILLVAIWYFTAGPGTYFWPMWCMLGWGIGLAFAYSRAYHGTANVEEEYEKLKREEASRH